MPKFVMLAVDQYVSSVHINKSYEIHSKLKTAELEARGYSDGDAANDAYKKLVPGWLGTICICAIVGYTPLHRDTLHWISDIGRGKFALMLLTTLMNGIFVCNGLVTSLSGLYGSPFMNEASIVLGVCEVILY